MKVRDLAFVAAATLVFAVVLTFLYTRLSESRLSLRFRSNIEKIDALVGADPDEARELLEPTSRFAYTASDWLSLLKRAYRLFPAGRDPELTAELAARARREFPGNEAITAIYVHSSLRRGVIPDALKAAETLSDPRFAAVKAEAYLQAGLLLETSASESSPNILTRVVESRVPEDYFLAAELTGDVRFSVDAILLLLQSGRIEDALEELSALQVSTSPRMGFFAAYDAGDDRLLKLYLREITRKGELNEDVQLVYADYLLASGNPLEATAVYEESLTGLGSPVPRVNLSVLLLDRDPNRSLSLVAQAADAFPHDPAVLANHLATMVRAGDRPQAEVFAQSYRSRVSGDGRLAAMFVELSRRPTDPPNRTLSRLWEAHETVDTPAPVARLLTWHLYGVRDHETVLEVALDPRYAGTDWAELYLSAYDAQRGDLNRALDRLSGDNNGFYALYNRSEVLAALDEHESAVVAAERALGLVAGECGRRCGELLARVRLRMARSLWEDGRLEEAADHLALAVAADPTLSGAQQLLTQLESY